MSNEILIIDDNADIRELISGILKDKGFSVRLAANFNQAHNLQMLYCLLGPLNFFRSLLK